MTILRTTFFFLILPPPPRSTLFPYTTLFRSLRHEDRIPERQEEEAAGGPVSPRSEEHTSELQSRLHLVCRLLLEKKKSSLASRSTAFRQNRLMPCLGCVCVSFTWNFPESSSE